MLRICMIAYSEYPADTRIRREAEALIDRGDSVDIICLGEQGDANPDEKNGVRIIRIPMPRYRGSNSKLYLLSYLYFFVVASFKLTILHFKNSYQIIQVHTMPDFMVFTALVPRLMGAKIILDVHDLMPELYESKFGSKRKQNAIRFITWMELMSIRFAHRAIAVHQPHLEALCRHGNPPEKFTVLLNLPDKKIFNQLTTDPPQNRPGMELIYHGMVARRNGLEIAIRAIDLLKDDLQHLTLKIIGDGDDILRLRDLVTEMKLEGWVQISKGMLSLEEIVPIIQNADVGIVPILYDEFTRYMLPVKLLEYVAMGKPVICSRTETIEAYFNDRMVLYISPGDVRQTAAAIRELYECPEERKRIAGAASQFTQEYNWEKQKQVYYQLVDGLVRNFRNLDSPVKNR